MTVKQTVSGIARIEPIGPHSHIQNTIEPITAKGGRNACGGSIQNGLEQIVGNKLVENEQPKHEARTPPVVENCQGDHEGNQ